VDHALELEVLVEREVGGHVLAMLPRRDQHGAAERRIRVQERDRPLVLVDDMVGVIRVARDDGADEAPAPHALEIPVEIRRRAAAHSPYPTPTR
jgi:hypothetical protein